MWIRALLRNAESADLELQVGEEVQTLSMADDGQSLDGEANDGVWGVEVPAFPNQSRVKYRVVARNGPRDGDYPRSLSVEAPLPWEYRGYFVFDNEPDTELIPMCVLPSRCWLSVEHLHIIATGLR